MSSYAATVDSSIFVVLGKPMFEFCAQHPSGIEKAAYAIQDTKIPHTREGGTWHTTC
ncbi:hypothetical protein CBM2634_P150010 [Cupriavidus taiwanensis]|uniref:Uncharacterized protein n=1 Tax=Cupriavidus taiwanensis TaxID=164546 RepID=A0A375JBC1_9BURK|nr:hypothetical protein CBM2634_P150010 [Cupriavidus taiwanensis]